MRVAGAFSSKAREPIASSVLLKGHRMAHINQNTAQIIDLDKETITSVDFAKRTYSVMTFEQMKQMMQQATDRMGQKQNDADVNFKASVRETGQSKMVSGQNAKEVILTLTMEGTDKKTGDQGAMNVISDMWMAPDIPGYREIRDFHRLMATKISWAPGQSFGAMICRSDMAKGMADLGKEMAKLEGVPVLQVMSMTGSGTPAGADRPSNPPPANENASQGSAADALGRLGRLSGIGGFGRKKKDQDASSQAPANNSSASAPGALMEITTESSGFSSAPVDESKFEIPAGFQQVDPQANRRGRR